MDQGSDAADIKVDVDHGADVIVVFNITAVSDCLPLQ